jgi:D-methionine transport system ATP-binding protein
MNELWSSDFINSAVSLTDIQLTYSSNQGTLTVLKGVSLSIPKGQIFGIIGRSGAGKSTLLRCLNGLETPDCGQIYLEEQPLLHTSISERRKILHKIGTVFQHFNLLSRRNVLQNIALPLEFMGVSADEITVRTRKIADLVGLSDKYNAYPNQLSGGQNQRVAIARALVSDVSLLLCDEFTSSLDPQTSLEILALLQDLNRRLGITIVLVTHDISVIREICDQVCVLDKGEIVEKGPVESILLNPQHDITRSLVSHLFIKDLPHTLSEALHSDPCPNDHTVLRLFFSADSSSQPAIADIIQKFQVPINIVMGNLGHVREIAFGSMVVTLPTYCTPGGDALLSRILAYCQSRHISAEILGFIPAP